jgi:hypothetical protein
MDKKGLQTGKSTDREKSALVVPNKVPANPEISHIRNRINLTLPSVLSHKNNKVTKEAKRLIKTIENNRIPNAPHDVIKNLSVRRPTNKIVRHSTTKKQRETHLLHRRVKKSTVSVAAAKVDDNTTLNYCLCQAKPYYNPYKLRRVKKQDINEKNGIYFIKNNIGVTLYQYGEDPIFTNNDIWEKQHRLFSVIKKKKYFLTFRQRTVFVAWKKICRNNKFTNAGNKIRNTLFVFKPIYNKSIFDIHELLQTCRNIITHFSKENIPNDGYNLDEFLTTQRNFIQSHHEVIKLHHKKIKDVVLQCCTDIYIANDIPIEGHVNLVDISQRRNLQALLKRYIKLIEFYIRANVEAFIVDRELQISTFFPAGGTICLGDTSGSINFSDSEEEKEEMEGNNKNITNHFKRIFILIHGKVNFKEENKLFEMKPSFPTIRESLNNIFDEFLQM